LNPNYNLGYHESNNMNTLTQPDKLLEEPAQAAPNAGTPPPLPKDSMTLAEAWNLLMADMRRKRAGFASLPHDRTFSRRYIRLNFEFGSIAVMIFRYGQWAVRLKNPLLKLIFGWSYQIIRVLSMALTGISVNASSTVGPGFIIHNFSCIFVWAEQIGESCTVNQGVTIGNLRGSGGLPKLGNHVYVGAGAKVLGNVKIGDNVVIAANSLVIMDVPDNATVMGVPARIIARSASSEYLKF
jgi:serine O-acetyltransferase